MPGKKKKKQEQTFNVYPYLGGYQHFMKTGGTLPKYREDGQVNLNQIVRRIKPTNKYQYDRTFEGVTEEWKNNVGNTDDRDKYNTLGGLGPMGLMANLFKGAGDLVGDVKGAFDKDSYKPGGKYSKFDADGALRYGKVNLTNTRDENALLHGENMAKYIGMSNKERKKLIESGDLRNTDLWWTPDEMTHGKWNWMDKNEEGLPQFDGVNYRVSKMRSEHYRNPDEGTCSDPQYTNGADCEANGGVWTGDSLFGIKTKNKDGTFTYFHPDGTVDYDKSTQTQYDLIEEGKGEGGLRDINAQTMIFDFDKEGSNKLSGFTSYDEVTKTVSSCSDGTSTTKEECEKNYAVWTEGQPTSGIELQESEYDPNKIYGPYTKTEEVQGKSEQQKLNEKALEDAENKDDGARYGRELRKYTIGGAGQDDQAAGGRAGDFEGNFDVFENNFKTDYRYGGTLPKFQGPDKSEIKAYKKAFNKDYDSNVSKRDTEWILQNLYDQGFNSATDTIISSGNATPFTNAQKNFLAANIRMNNALNRSTTNTTTHPFQHGDHSYQAVSKKQEGGEEEETIDEREKRLYEESLVQLPPTETEMRFDGPVANFNREYNDPTSAMNMPWAQPGSFGNPNKEIDLQPEPKSNWEEPNMVDKFKNWWKGDAHLNKDPGPDYANNAEFDASIEEINEAHANNPRVLDPTNRTDMEGAAGGFTCSDGVSTTREECEKNGGTWNDPQDMGVDVSYGDGPIQSTWNKGKEFFNTGPVGAVKDVWASTSEFIVDKAAPFLEDIYNRNVNKQNEMFKRSISAEDVAPVMEETAGTGSKGFYDVNKGGYGDSLYGTGKVFGQVQQGKELMEPQSDLSGVVNYMDPEFNFLKYKDEYLDKQKMYLGKMKNGAELPKAQTGLTQPGRIKQGGQWVWNGFKWMWDSTKRWNPFAFNPIDNVFISRGKQPEFTKINFTKTPVGGNPKENIAFLNIKDNSAVEMVSVLNDYRKTGLGTYLYDVGIKSTQYGGNKYPGLISGETLDDPEATVNIWKYFDYDVNEGALKSGKFKKDENFKPESILDSDYNFNTRVKLRGLNASGEDKVRETKEFYENLGKDEGNLYQMEIDRVGGNTDWHSPLWRGWQSGFTDQAANVRIGNGSDIKTYYDYNKLPLITVPALLGLGAYNLFTTDDNIDTVEDKKKVDEWLLKKARENGFNNTEDYINHIQNSEKQSTQNNNVLKKYQDSLDFGIYKKGGQPGLWANIHAKRKRGGKKCKPGDDCYPSAKEWAKNTARYGYELPQFLRGGNTASEGAVLCDAYDRPVGPTNEENSKADYSAPVLPYDDDKKGGAECAIPGTCPGMRWGGALPRHQTKGEIKAYSKALNLKKRDTKNLLNELINQGANLETDTIIGAQGNDRQHVVDNLIDNIDQYPPYFNQFSPLNMYAPELRQYPNIFNSRQAYVALPKKEEGGNWNLKGWLKGEQGFIPDYKGESTKKTISENESVNKALDKTQTALTVGGMQDWTGPIASGLDGINTAISGARAYSAPEGSDQRKKHTENMALNATSMIPGLGLASGATSLAKDTATYAGVLDDQSMTKTVADTTTSIQNKDITTKDPIGTIGENKARYGGEEEADIDMKLYYELLKAGANIEIIG